ncbi:uncharacterized protein FOMMEDRAFT_155254 [Fomitiporia mediterranea MF3/22]|uniref:uncharacterized protein n=1 Tax=Fomitiporia mediterranea (strain MF3/22) TaxID=694068 RepID=UPI00044096FF|nr:uncharacterized protein FOMMEDRAFT_155254 [Fomitiporia mediterranea MF3/22]EJD04129.1 hypothetical protein FOMMEDRAFT_155254 [Fomitiporia mediterranea MF3/22]
MQGYSAVPAPYASYMYAPQGGAAYGHGAPPPLGPHQLSGSRYDPAVPPPGAYMAQLGGPPVIPPNPGGAVPRHRRLHEHDRSASDPVKKPLRSAMKRQPGTPGPGPNPNLHRSRTVPGIDPDNYRGREMKPTASQMSRGRSISGSERVRATSLSRHRSRSQSRRNYTPAHLILSLNGTCRMNLSSVIYQETVDNIRERVLTMWPDGVIFQTYRDETNEFLVQFSGTPWTARGSLGLMAMKMILELFAVLARQGYACISAIDTGHTAIFSVNQPESSAEFAMIIFSNNRRKIKLINHAHQFCESLTDLVHEQFPHRIRSASWDDSDMYQIEMKRLDFDNIADLMIATILEHASSSGLKLEGTIPLSHSGFWGFLQGRKELWIFRRLPSFS